MRDLISPEYAALQRELHERLPEYGISSFLHAAKVQKLIEHCGANSVLDYGCGKGELRKALGDIVREYDPGIPGKDGEPEPADIVVCTDVLEHIEPDKLDAVLDHIRNLARKSVTMVVATRPSNKTLADGRNAHLIIESADWWRDKLSIYFDIETYSKNENGIGIIGSPYLTIGDIHAVGVMSDDERFCHVERNIAATDKRCSPTEPHNRAAILLCYGPSLQDTWQSAIEERREIEIADFVSVSGAHDFVLSKGIVPRYHIECDPRKHKGDMITTPHEAVEYLMASCVHPEVIDKLKNFNLRIWHLDNGKQSYKIGKLEPGAMMIGGGGAVGLRAISLMYAMGYRRFIIHGMDCSYRGDDGVMTHAGKHTGKETKKITVVCKGRKFVSAPVLLAYLKQFDDMRQLHIGDPEIDPSKMDIILRGDGLLQHALLSCGGAEAGPMVNEAA